MFLREMSLNPWVIFSWSVSSVLNYKSSLYTGGTPKTEFIYKKLCIYSYMFKLQLPSKYSLLDAINLLRHFFPLLKTLFELVNFDAF